MVAPAVAAAELSAWEPGDEAQRALKFALLAFLDARPADACTRECVPGHLTASALVLDATGQRTLLTLRWWPVDALPDGADTVATMVARAGGSGRPPSRPVRA